MNHWIIGEGTVIDKPLTKKLITTNKDYVGSDNNDNHYYIRKHLKEGEIKMTQFNKLKDGKYNVAITKVYENVGTNEREGITTLNIEVEVDLGKVTPTFEYVTYRIKTGNPEADSKTAEYIDKLCESFGVPTVDALYNEENPIFGTLQVSTTTVNGKEYQNKRLFPKREYNTYEHSIEVPAFAKKFFKSKVGNKMNLLVLIPKVNGQTNVEEVVSYDLDNEFGKKHFDKLLKEAKLTMGDEGNDFEFKGTLKIKVVPKIDNPEETIAFKSFFPPEIPRKSVFRRK